MLPHQVFGCGDFRLAVLLIGESLRNGESRRGSRENRSGCKGIVEKLSAAALFVHSEPSSGLWPDSKDAGRRQYVSSHRRLADFQHGSFSYASCTALTDTVIRASVRMSEFC